MSLGWWVVATTFVAQLFQAGTQTYGWSLLAPEVARDLGSDMQTMNLAMTGAGIVGLAVPPIAGPLVDRSVHHGHAAVTELSFDQVRTDPLRCTEQVVGPAARAAGGLLLDESGPLEFGGRHRAARRSEKRAPTEPGGGISQKARRFRNDLTHEKTTLGS